MDFLAERAAAYTAGKKTADDFKKDANWQKQLQDPVELFRIIRNATIPHDASPDAKQIRDGTALFISYFGNGNRADAVKFLREAHKFIVP